MDINIGTELQLLSATFGVANPVLTNDTPLVSEVVVAAPTIHRRSRLKRAVAVSAVKKTPIVHAKALITLAAPNEVEDESEDFSTGRQDLAALFRPEPMIAVVVKKNIHSVAKADAPKKVDTQVPVPIEVAAPPSGIHKEQVATPLEYSELIAYFNNRVKPAASVAGAPIRHSQHVALPHTMSKPLTMPEPVLTTRFLDFAKIGPTPGEATSVRAAAGESMTIQTPAVGNDSSGATDATKVTTQVAGTLVSPIDVRTYMRTQDKVPTQEGPAKPAHMVSTNQGGSVTLTQNPSRKGVDLFGEGVNSQAPIAANTQPVVPAPAAPPAPIDQHGLLALATDLPVEPAAPFSGRVLEAFTGGATPVSGALVQVLGTTLRGTTDEKGGFSFAGVKVNGVLPVVITKDGFLKRQLELKPTSRADIELVSENSVSLTAVAAGESRGAAGGYIFGQLVSVTGESLEGFTVDINGSSFLKPLYADSNGAPSRTLTATSERGQFMALNVPPGTYHVSCPGWAARRSCS
ncbi:MAG: hypothetical protein HY074_08990 [Deltaproteobacteria bacterium]|nr:hypothetical protein [Deltaproteobacteria bacterium]